MDPGKVTFVVMILTSAMSSVAPTPLSYTESHQFRHSKRAAVVLKFEGCFSDTKNEALQHAAKFDTPDNTNDACVVKCAEKGFAISSTKGPVCYCNNILPLPQLYKPSNESSSGAGGPCSTACPGTSAAKEKIPCRGDECCGGPSAYSVYLSGEIDVLKQVLRRITFKEMKRPTHVHTSICDSPEYIDSLQDPYMHDYYKDYCAKQKGTFVSGYYQVTASGRSANSQGIQGIKECTLKTETNTGHEEYTCKDIAAVPEEFLMLEVKSMNKLLQSTEPVREELATEYDIMNDNLNGASDLTLTKTYEVTTSFSESWTTEHGFDISVTIGVGFEAGALFAKASTSLEISVGYSFTSGYTKSQGKDVTESFSVVSVAKPGTKEETRFFKTQMPVQVKWRASIFVNGYVHIEDAGDGPDKLKVSNPNIVEVLTYEEREFFAFGTIDYGSRKTIIARSKTVDREGNVIAQNDNSRSVD